MKWFIIVFFAYGISLLSACSGNKAHSSATAAQDSLNATLSSATAMDSTGGRSSNVAGSEQAADSAALSGATKMFGMSIDSNSLAHMKDSMLALAKDKLGKNAGVMDSVMSALSKLSSSSSNASGASDSSTSKRSIPYHEPLADDYVIPVSGNGNGFYYEYAGGSEFNGKKSGLSLTMLLDPAKTSGWDLLIDGYAQVAQFGINTHFLFLLDNGFTHLVLNADHKVYTAQKAEQAIQEKNYSVTDIKVMKVGNEKLHGFNCVHAKVTAVTHFMGQNTNNEFDIWRSEEVPGASQLESTIQVLASPFTLSMEDRLVKSGCKGAIVKIEFNEKTMIVRKELFKITRQDIDDSIFNVPSDYKEDKNTSLYSLMPGN